MKKIYNGVKLAMTLKYPIVGKGTIEIDYILLDLNGTISQYTIVPSGVKEYLADLKRGAKIYIVSADTYGTAKKIADNLGVELYKLDREGNPDKSEAQLKEALVHQLGADRVCAIGNGRNDSLMLKAAKLGIVIMGKEGAAVETLLNADLVFHDILHALKVLTNPQTLNASLRS